MKLAWGTVRDATLSDRGFRLLAEIKTYAWEPIGSDCSASQETLAKDLGWSVSKVKRAAAELLKRGLIEREQVRGETNHYRPTQPSSDLGGRSDLNGGGRSDLTYEVDEEKKMKRSSSGNPAEHAPAAATTTSRIPVSDESGDAEAEEDREEDARSEVERFRGIVEYATGRRPAPRPADLQRARACLDLIADEDGGPGLFAWAARDPYTAPRLHGYPSVEQYTAMRAAFWAIPRATCTRCSERFVPSDEHRQEIKQGAYPWCDECDQRNVAEPLDEDVSF